MDMSPASAKVVQPKKAIPAKNRTPELRHPEDPLLSAIGKFSHIWKGVDADEYVESLRKDWGDDDR